MSSRDIVEIIEEMRRVACSCSTAAVPQDVEHELESCFIQLSELIKLFLISERDSYYGYFLLNMRFEANFESAIIAGIKLDEFPPVFMSNPMLLAQYELQEILYIYCHEIDHVVYNHPSEMARTCSDREPKSYQLFNLAADAAVNDLLNFEIIQGHTFVKQPNGAVTSEYLKTNFYLSGLQPMQSYRYYFDALMNSDCELSNAPNGIAPIPSHHDFGESTQLSTEGRLHNTSEIIDHAWSSSYDEDPVAIETAIKELVNNSYGMMSEETRGLMPARFKTQISKINAPAILPWHAMLKRFIGTVTSGKQKTRTRLNRRQPYRYDISGDLESKTLKLVVALDTSASVSTSEISVIFNELFSILAHKKYEMTVIECDSEIQKVYRAKTKNDVDLNIQGRGGTAFTPVIEYINQHRELRGSVLIYFTDGFGEERIPKPHTYKNLWVVLDDIDNLSLENPYGSAICLKRQEV